MPRQKRKRIKNSGASFSEDETGLYGGQAQEIYYDGGS